MKRLFALALLLVTVVLPTVPLRAAEGPADVLAAAPSEAWAVIYVRQVGEMDQKLNSLVQQLNAPIPFQNPVTMGLSMLGFVSGVDNAGSVGIVLLPSPSFQALEDHAALLIPTQDPKALLSLMEPTEVEPGVSKVMLQNQEVFVGQKGGHAVLSSSTDALKMVLVSKTSVRSKLSAYQAKHVEKDDLVIWLNAQAVTTSDAFKTVAPLLQAANIDASMLTDLRTLALSLRLSPAGLGLGAYVDAIPGTACEKSMSSQKGTAGSLLLGLPKERYVVGYGAVTSKEASEMGANMLSKLMDNPQLQAMKLDAAKLTQAKTIVTALLKSSRGIAVSVSGLPEGPDGLITLTKVATIEGDAKQMLASVAELIGIIKGGLITDEAAAPILAAIEYKAGAENIGGASVDHLVFDLAKAMAKEGEQAQEAVAAVAKVLGKDGILFRMAAVDATHVVMTFGGGAERFKSVAALVKDKQTPLADEGGIQRSRAHLPATRNAEGYLAVDQLLNVISAIAKAVDAPMPPLSLGELNAPIAVGAEPAEPGGAQMEAFVPMELVIAVKDLAMGMAGGGPGPGSRSPGSQPAPRAGERGPKPQGAGEAPKGDHP